MNISNRPFYKKLYADMIRDKYPEKAALCANFFKKDSWISLDVIRINEILFGSGKESVDVRVDRKHRAYDRDSILEILQYQVKNELTNSAIVEEFGISRNTISKWKIAFKEELETFI